MATVVNRTGGRIAPGPRGHLLWGSLRELQRDPLKLYMDARREYGDIVRLRSMPPFFWHSLAHPDDIDHVLRRNATNYPKGFFNEWLSILVGNGLLTSEGDFWLRQRRLTQPAFHRKRLVTLGTAMTAATEAMVEQWSARRESDAPFDVMSEMMRLTLQVVGQALFTTDTADVARVVGQAVSVAVEHLNYRVTHITLLPERFPTPRNRRFVAARRTLDDIVLAIVEERRRSGEDTGDLLSMLLLARDEDTGEGMSDRQLRDEVMTLFLAVHETTAVALCWTWYLLSRHPEIEANLHDELAAVLGGRTPEMEDLPRLPYTRMVVDETLRLYPPAWGMGRQTKAADEIRGYEIPAKSVIGISQYVTHRHPEFWEDPERFDPERFTPERSAGRPHFAYFPFGGGPRQCIGNNFALMEAQLILATVAQHFRLRVVPGFPVVPHPLLTLRPRNGLLVTAQSHRMP